MSGIDSVQHIVAAIRAEMAVKVNGTATHAGTPLKRAVKNKAATTAQQQGIGSLISQRMRSLDPDDPGHGRKAFRIFLESVLVAEFGEDLINDHAFYQMIDAVQHTMEQDAQVAAAIQQAVAGLLNSQR